MTKKIQKCYFYTRVSTAIQVDGYSLEAQKDKLRKYAEFQDYSIAGEYSDEGFSGKNIQGRLDFQACSRISRTVKTMLIMSWYSSGRAELTAADAGFRCEPDLRGRRDRQFQGCWEADDLRVVRCCGDRA